MNKKLGIFDIDGVIYEGHSIFDLIQDMEKSGFIIAGLWESILLILEEYKNGSKTYKSAADEMLLNFSKSLKGRIYSEVLEYNLDFIKRYENKIFPYIKNLIPKLNNTYDIYFVTNNFDFTAEAFLKYFSITGYLSSLIGQTKGVINGDIKLSLGGNKGVITDLLDKYGKSGSFAAGNSGNDIDMLIKVEHVYAIEPDEKLSEFANSRHWTIVDRNTITESILALV